MQVLLQSIFKPVTNLRDLNHEDKFNNTFNLVEAPTPRDSYISLYSQHNHACRQDHCNSLCHVRSSLWGRPIMSVVTADYERDNRVVNSCCDEHEASFKRWLVSLVEMRIRGIRRNVEITQYKK